MEKNARIVEETNENYIEGTDEPSPNSNTGSVTSMVNTGGFTLLELSSVATNNNKVEHILNISLDITERLKPNKYSFRKQQSSSNRTEAWRSSLLSQVTI